MFRSDKNGNFKKKDVYIFFDKAQPCIEQVGGLRESILWSKRKKETCFDKFLNITSSFNSIFLTFSSVHVVSFLNFL